MSGSGLGISTLIGYYPLGTPFTATNTWDKPNHRFITFLQVKGDPDSRRRVVVPYFVPDSDSPAYPYKQFDSMAYSLNCTSTQTSAEIEAFFDNVIVNNPPPFE